MTTACAGSISASQAESRTSWLLPWWQKADSKRQTFGSLQLLSFFAGRDGIMSRLYSFSAWLFNSLGIALALLVPLAVPEDVFADAGGDCGSSCNSSCTASCNGNSACYETCMADCTQGCCANACNGDPTCGSTCCQEACGGDQGCINYCSAGQVPPTCVTECGCNVMPKTDCGGMVGGCANACDCTGGGMHGCETN